jgi:hypothetical protein
MQPMEQQDDAEIEVEPEDEAVDEPAELPAAMAPPPAAPMPALSERSYRLVLVRPTEDGSIAVDMRTALPTTVYDRRVAIRYSQHEAKQMSDDSPSRPLLALLDPGDRVIGVYQPRTGRPAPPHVVRAVRRAVSVLLPRRKTSRLPRRPGAQIANRKTSRRIGRARLR